VSVDRGPRVDLHSHAGRCFLAGLPAGHSLVAALGAAPAADAVRAARAAGVTALCLSAVADFAVLRPDPATGLRAHREFRPGEAYADYSRQLAGISEAVAAAGAEVATSAADLDGNYRPVLTSYDQLDDLASLLRDRGLPVTPIHQILGSNALNLLNRVL
jgi:microsomal dipeptidase-like Zn-dependent dipeptidase